MKKHVKNLLRTVSIFLVVVFIFVFNTTSSFALEPDSFTDVPSSHWAYQSIMNMVRLGVISGYPDGTFKPDKPVSREEFAKILCGATSTPLANPSTNTFADVPTNYWAFRYVETVKDYLTGYPAINGGKPLFKGVQDATREDVAVALVKIKGFDKSVIANPRILDDMFKDVETVSSNLKSLVAIAVEKKLITGYTDQTIRASQTLTRAEAATLIDRANRIAGSVKDDNLQSTAPNLIYLSIECANVGKVGETLDVSASGVYTDGNVKNLTSDVKWNVSDSTIASINNGVITLKKNGSCTITATYENRSDSEDITVLPKYPYIPNKPGSSGTDVDDEDVVAIKVVPDVKQIKVGEAVTFKSMAYYDDEDESKNVTKYTTWESTDNNVAIINNEGKAIGVKPGITIIKASYDDKIAYAALTVTQDVYSQTDAKSLISIEFSHSTKFLKKGESTKVHILGTYGNKSKVDITTNVKWTIENEKIAYVNSDGTIVGLSEGMTKITVTKDGKSSSMFIFVSKSK